MTNLWPYGLTTRRCSRAAPWNTSSVLPDGSSKTISSSTRRSASSVGRALLVRRALRRRGVAGSPAAQPHWRSPSPDRSSRSCSPGHDHQPGREVVHPQVQRARVGAPALDHAEHLEPVLAPRRHVGGLDAQVPQRTDTHRYPLPRKSMASRLNSSNFSSCAQWPHCRRRAAARAGSA